MMDTYDGLQPVVAGALLYLATWALWRCCLSRRRKDVEAEQRAGALLSEVLTRRERQELARFGRVVVRNAGEAGREYRIPALPGWVDVFEHGKLARRVCVQTDEDLAAADIVVMHRLMIEGNEQEYLRLASDWRARRN